MEPNLKETRQPSLAVSILGLFAIIAVIVIGLKLSIGTQMAVFCGAAGQGKDQQQCQQQGKQSLSHVPVSPLSLSAVHPSTPIYIIYRRWAADNYLAA